MPHVLGGQCRLGRRREGKSTGRGRVLGEERMGIGRKTIFPLCSGG